jgi:carboxymethylenebutenolidase
LLEARSARKGCVLAVACAAGFNPINNSKEASMRRATLIIGLISLSLAASVVTAQQRVGVSGVAQGPGPLERLENSPRHHEWVDIDAAGGRKVRTWVVYPEVDHPATVVIVIHENRGLTDWVRGVGDQLAEAGYLAVAPDLLSGTAPGGGGTAEFGSEDAARTGIGKLSQNQVTADLDAVFEYAKELPAGNKAVAVGGFCWGGGQAFHYATHNPRIAAAFVFYGSAPTHEPAYQRINAPVYGFYGGNDFRITGQVPEVEKRMRALGKNYEPVVYKGAGHGFMRQGESADAGSADRKARNEGWERWKNLLGQLRS